MSNMNMFYGAKPHIFEKAKSLRKNLIEAESKLWEKLKTKSILGLRFRSQHIISEFITDFYCHSIKLVIEIDGGYHKEKSQAAYDIVRSHELRRFGIPIIRFTNEEIHNSLEKVTEELTSKCRNMKQLNKSPLQGI